MSTAAKIETKLTVKTFKFSCPEVAPVISDSRFHFLAERAIKLNITANDLLGKNPLENERLVNCISEMIAHNLFYEDHFFYSPFINPRSPSSPLQFEVRTEEKNYEGIPFLKDGKIFYNGDWVNVTGHFDSEKSCNFLEIEVFEGLVEAKKQLIKLMVPVAVEKVVPLALELIQEKLKNASTFNPYKKHSWKDKFLSFLGLSDK